MSQAKLFEPPVSEKPKPTLRADKFPEELAGVFTDPLIVWPSAWQADIPDRLKEQVTIERLIEVKKLATGEKVSATDAEIVCYMFPRSMETPMGSDWTDIYTYISARVVKRMSPATPDETLKDIAPKSLTDDQLRDLEHLRNWIYEQRLLHRKDRARLERLEFQKQPSLDVVATSAQASLFDT